MHLTKLKWVTPGWRLVLSCPALFVSLIVADPAHSANISFLYPKGFVAATQRSHFIEIVLLVMIVVIPVLVLTPLVAWRYRFRNTSARYTPNWGFSWTLDGLIWGIPFAIVVVLSVWLVENTVALDPYRPLTAATATGKTPLRVQVIGYDWKWLFVYPDLGIASMGQFAFPDDRQVAFDLTTNTVLQSFFIPALAGQIYAMPGMVTHLHLNAEEPGGYHGENVQFNGRYFYKQKFEAKAMTPQAFEAWADGIKSGGIPLTRSAYDAIEKRSSVEQTRDALNAKGMPKDALFFKGVPASLFHEVVHSFHGGPSVSHFLREAAAEKGTAPQLASSGE